MLPANRLSKLPPYLFVEIDRRKRAAAEQGHDVIDFGVGDPDQPTPQFIVDQLVEAASDRSTHRYALGIGSESFRRAASDYAQRRFGVSLDPSCEVLALLGTKEGIGHLPLAVVNPGEVVLVPDPGYPVYQSGTIFAGGEVHLMQLVPEKGWLPDFSRIPREVRQRAKLMYLNYPSNPTAACAPLSFFEEAVGFAREYGMVIAQDAAYAEIYFDDPPPSILQVDGARDICIEFHSLSKTFNMTGWRIGFAAGNAAVLAALAKVKDNIDSGVFEAVQRAGIVALASCHPGGKEPRASARADSANRTAAASVDSSGPSLAPSKMLTQTCTVEAIRDLYRGRRDALVPGLQAAGWDVESPSASFYVWARCPEGYDSMATASRILEEVHVVVIPGVGFGSAGEGYVRFALTVDESRTRQAAKRIAAIAW